MREIKFRAWDGDTMIRQELLQWDGKRFYSPNDEDVTLMQYTGLKDKNGKEIFEGDVLSIPDAYHDYQDGIAISELPENRFEQVNCHQGTFWAGNEWLYEECQHSEVIGNIYENPELIKTT